MAGAFAALVLGLAAPVIASPPEAISVTIYRNPEPETGADPATASGETDGFALITETRSVDLPAGMSEVRFEGVAGGLVPQSVAIQGLPDGALERNFDTRLLTPGALVDARLGKRVHVRRTFRQTGRVQELEAELLSGPDGLVLRTAEGIEALRCAGLPETPVFDGVPAGLVDKPTLSIRAHALAPQRAQLRLSYLASGFGWRADYVAQLAPDEKSLGLFAWLTLVNRNGESFTGAATQAVAGRLDRAEEEPATTRPGLWQIEYRCWPMDTTTTFPVEEIELRQSNTAEQLIRVDSAEEIIVTATRLAPPRFMNTPVTAVIATEEELGDLKLYRLPEPVTLAASAQKQVALLTRPRVRFKPVYRATLWAGTGGEDVVPLTLTLRIENKERVGLGVALPAGRIAIFDGPALVARSQLADTAVGETLELQAGAGPDVQLRHVAEQSKRESRRIRLELSNARPEPVEAEITLPPGPGNKLTRVGEELTWRNGQPVWAVSVPAGKVRTLRYTIEVD